MQYFYKTVCLGMPYALIDQASNFKNVVIVLAVRKSFSAFIFMDDG